MDEGSLRQAVEAQARAYVEGELATFASYLTPRALASIHAAWRRSPPRSYSVMDVSVRDGNGESVVCFTGHGRLRHLRQRWERQDGLWKATEARVVAEEPHGIAARIRSLFAPGRGRDRA